MADKKISELTSMLGADTASDDFFIVVDTSGSATRKISRAELNNAIEQDVLAQVDITSANIDGGTIDNTPIGGTTASTGNFTTVDVTGTVTSDGATNSGDLLVGKTSVDSGVAGFEAESDGKIAATRNGARTAIFNRLTSDGEIVAFRKDGTTVGSIGTNSSIPYFLRTSGGIAIGNTALLSAGSSGAINDATSDLGGSSNRWKDLYLSGGVSNPSGALTFDTTGGEAMRINSSGNVGIGTSSPSSDISASTTVLEIAHSNLASLALNNTSAAKWEIASTASDYLTFRDENTERMRIDSSGNVLVGTTSTGAATASNGAYITPDGQIIGRSDGIVSYLNRRSTDGQILQFMKDGTQVGNIASVSSVDIAIGSGDTGIRFQQGDDSLRPTNSTGSTRDGAIDLGISSSRFKDLYLSGGAYLGGTGSANKLDDYEDGTGTFSSITDNTDTAVSVAYNGLNYTKIGSLVLLQIRVQLTTATTGEIRLNGVPFAIASLDSELGRVINRDVFAYNSSQLRIRAGASEKYLYGVVTYRTSA